MGKQNGKNKNQAVHSNGKQKSPKAKDKDTAVFISMSQELKEEGNMLFQKRDQEGATTKYEKAIKLLPRNHIDVSHLRSNVAACYMKMGLNEYPSAIHECNLALQVTPKYTKALLKRARCYEALNRLDLALEDVTAVLTMEPNNVMAIEVAERVKKEFEHKGPRGNDTVIELPPEFVKPPRTSTVSKPLKEKEPKKKNKKFEEEKAKDEIEEKQTEDKVVVEEQISGTKEEHKKTVKLVFGEDIKMHAGAS